MTPFPPIEPATVSAIADTFSKVSVVVTGLIGAVMVARFALLSMRVAGADEYAAVVQDAALFLITIALFPFLFKTGISAVTELAGKFEYREMNLSRGVMGEFVDQIKGMNYAFSAIIDITSMSFLYIVRTIFTLLLAILCSAIPLMLLTEFIFGVRIGVAAIGSTILALILWPVLWNIIGLLAIQIAPSQSGTSLAAGVFVFLVQLTQFLSPLICFVLLKSAAPHAVGGTAKSAATSFLTKGAAVGSFAWRSTDDDHEFITPKRGK